MFFHITYFFSPWCRVLLEKLTGLQLVKKFPAFYGTRRFITVLTSVRHLSLSWANVFPHYLPFSENFILCQVMCVCVFFHITSHKMKFSEKGTLNTKCVMIFSTTFVCSISQSPQNSSQYYRTCTCVFM